VLQCDLVRSLIRDSNLVPLAYRVYQNSTAKVQEWIPHVERRKNKYDDIGPEMYGYRVVRACIY
jgi:hypothetical protein